jgi:hypothetical protein
MNNSAIDLTLFGTQTLEPPSAPLRLQLKAVEWSYSKRNTGEQCPRRLYYEYYGSVLGKAKSEPQKDLLRSLKLLQNRHERVGAIVHLVIANYFRKAQAGQVLEPSRLISWARKLFSADIACSLAKQPKQSSSTEKFPPVQLVEFYYEQTEAHDLCMEAERKMVTALETFSSSPRYENIRMAGQRHAAEIEHHFRLKGFACRVVGVVDFALKTKEKPGIIDWKTCARTAGEDDSLQLTVYAIWGAEHFGCSAESVQVFKAFLGSGDLVRYRTTAASLQKAQKRILQDAERLAAMHPYGVEGRMGAFTACAQPRVCSLCPYVAACPEGRECLL